MPTSPPQIDVAQAVEMLERSGARLLDVREDDEWAAGHAPDAEHCPLSRVDPRAYKGDQAVVVVCRSGNRSQKAATALSDAGITAYNLVGGMTEWARSGHPLVRNDGTPGTVA